MKIEARNKPEVNAPIRSRRAALRTLAAGTVAGLAGAYAPLLRAQLMKTPLRMILPVSAGSGVDGIARAASNALSEAFGQPVVIENLPGAGGVVGTQTLIKSPPDGNTLGMVSNNHVIYPSVLKALPFDPINDITPIALVGSTPMVLVINPRLPAHNLKEFIALLRAQPGKMNYGSSGNGTILHLAAELFKEATHTYSTHIPYRGFGPMLQDIIGGQVDWGIGALPAVAGQLKAGTLRALCVASAQRVPAAPDIPTAVEQGVPNFVVEGWFAVVGPKGLPAAQVKRAHDAVAAAFATPEVKEAMAKQGNVIRISTPDEALAYFKSELARYAAVVKKAGVVPQ